jgi:hypothetical protein
MRESFPSPPPPVAQRTALHLLQSRPATWTPSKQQKVPTSFSPKLTCLKMSGAVPPEHSSPVPRNSKLKKLEPRITAARNSLDWAALSSLLQQHVTDSGRESIGGSSRGSHFTTTYMLARVDMLVIGERDGGLVEAVKFVNEVLTITNDRVLICICGSVLWCAGAQVHRCGTRQADGSFSLCCRYQFSARSSCVSCHRTGCSAETGKDTTSLPKFVTFG